MTATEKKYSEIDANIFHMTDQDLIRRMISGYAWTAVNMTGLSVSIRGRKTVNFIVCFYHSRIEACWTKMDWEDPATCERMAKIVSEKSGRDLFPVIMGRCYQIIHTLSLDSTKHLIASRLERPNEILDLIGFN